MDWISPLPSTIPDLILALPRPLALLLTTGLYSALTLVHALLSPFFIFCLIICCEE